MPAATGAEPEIIGTRNRLIYGYDTIAHDILWTIATQDFPGLAAHLKRILAH